MSLLMGSPLLFSPIVSFPLTLNSHPPELLPLAGVPCILIDLPVEEGVAYLLVEELGDEDVQPTALLGPLLIIPHLGVGFVGRIEFEISHLLKRDFIDGLLVFRRGRVPTLMRQVYGI